MKRILNSPRVSRVVCATDAGREGELIFRYIYEAAQCAKPVSRLWISSLTPDAIRKGFDALKPGARLRSAGRRRARAQPGRLAGGHESLARLLARLWRGALGRPRADADAGDGGRARTGDPRASCPKTISKSWRRSIPPARRRTSTYQGTWFRDAPEAEPTRSRCSRPCACPPMAKRPNRIVARARTGQAAIESIEVARRSACRRRCSTT